MDLPIKIDPDNLRDAMVAVRFVSLVPPIAVQGAVYPILAKDFELVATKHQQATMKSPVDMTVLLSEPVQYTDRKIKVAISETQIIFNIVEEYLGWNDYFARISDVLAKIHSAQIIASYQVVGVRYISEYRNAPILSSIKGEFTILNSIGLPPKDTHIRAQFDDGEYRVVVSIADNFSRAASEGNNIENFSLIDIDAQHRGAPITTLDVLLSRIDATHAKQKMFFFNIVTDAFVKERNPRYLIQ